MARGQGQKYKSRRPARWGKLKKCYWPPSTVRDHLDGSWGWRVPDNIVYEEDGIAVIAHSDVIETEIALIYARRGANKTDFTSLLETRVPNRKADAYLDRFKALGRRLVKLQDAGWALRPQGYHASTIVWLPDPEEDGLGWNWTSSEGVLADHNEPLISGMEADLAALPDDAAAIAERHLENHRPYLYELAGDYAVFDDSQRDELVDGALSVLRSSGQINGDESFFREALAVARREKLGTTRQQGANRRLRRIVAGRRGD